MRPDVLGGVGVEDLVVEPDEAAAVGLEVAAAGDAHRLDRGGTVERLGHRRPPVDDERREIVLGDRDPADVERAVGDGVARRLALARFEVGRRQVETAEAQRGVADVEGGQPPAGVGLGRFPFEPRLQGAALLDRVALGDALRRPPHGIEPCVGRVEVALFRLQFRLSQRRAPASGELESLRPGGRHSGARCGSNLLGRGHGDVLEQQHRVPERPTAPISGSSPPVPVPVLSSQRPPRLGSSAVVIVAEVPLEGADDTAVDDDEHRPAADGQPRSRRRRRAPAGEQGVVALVARAVDGRTSR